ncbi:MAG: hypothetical protein ACE37H_01980 [Phycisphaeraceae bacterium]
MAAQDHDRIEQLSRTNRRLKLLCGGLASLFLLGVGMAMQGELGEGNHDGGTGAVEAAVGVSDSTGFAVFARPDGNVVIVKDDGTTIATQHQPLSVSF